MIQAERLLLGAALEDPANQRFVLLSNRDYIISKGSSCDVLRNLGNVISCKAILACAYAEDYEKATAAATLVLQIGFVLGV